MANFEVEARKNAKYSDANHMVFDNEVLESKLDDLLETRLNAINLMTVDNSLVAAPGARKVVNVYRYEGNMDEVAMGAGNEDTGKVTFEAKEYPVAVYQQSFSYFDEQAMVDPMVVEVGLKGMAATMIKDLNGKFFEAIAVPREGEEGAEEARAGRLVLPVASATLKYEHVVDAIASMADVDNNKGSLAGEDDLPGLFLLISPEQKADLRKDKDFIASRQGEILYNGQIGTICGMPIVVSRSVKAGEAYVMNREAVTLFVKKASEVEQDRNPNIRQNTIYGRRVCLVALTDATKIVELQITK